MTDANDRQEGGAHYMTDAYGRERMIQPWDIVAMYDLDFFEGNVVKYVLRRKEHADRVTDLEKARHYLDKKIELLRAQGKGKQHQTFISEAEHQRRETQTE